MPTDPNDVTDLVEIGNTEWATALDAVKDTGAADDLTEVMSTARKSLDDALGKARQLGVRVEQIEADDTLPAEARTRMAREAREAAQTASKDAVERVDATLTVAKQKLAKAALPPLPDDPREVALLRDELKMVLDSAEDPLGMATSIAGGGDRAAAAVVASSWGSRYLQSRGYSDVDGLLRDSAIEGAASILVDNVPGGADFTGA